MKKTALLSLLAVIAFSCNRVQDTKFDKQSLQMNADYRSLQALHLEPRYDIVHDSLTVFLKVNNGNSALARDFTEIVKVLQKALNKPIEEIPSLENTNNRVWQLLNLYQGKSVYQDFANWAGYGMLKVYFLRMGNLNANEKLMLGNYLTLLIAQKNVNLTELSDALVKMNGFWTSQQRKIAAQNILNYYKIYEESWAKELSNTDVSQFDNTISPFLQTIKQDLAVDAQAKVTLQQIIDAN